MYYHRQRIMRRGMQTTIYGGRLLAALFALLVMMTGCGTSRTAREEGSIMVYYLNKEQTSVVTAPYIPDAALLQADRAQELIDELLVRMTQPEDTTSQMAPITENMVSSWSLENGILSLDMAADYRKMDTTREILVRAALVNTLCNVRGVDGVAITVLGEPLKDGAGNPLGAQSGEDYIFSSDSELRAYEQARLHLYFADESGTRLVSTYRTVVYNSNIAQEHLVTEEVLKGPNTDVVYPTINADTNILSVTTRDEICYVNLDHSFLTDPYDVTSQVAIYSLVNSLTELPSVSAVQISIEGDTQESFMDTSLSNVFTRDLSLVEN